MSDAPEAPVPETPAAPAPEQPPRRQPAGKLALANDRGSYRQSAVKLFVPEDGRPVDMLINQWGEEHPGLLIVDVKPAGDGTVLVAYTNALDEGELEEFQSFQRDWEEFKAQKKAKIAEAEAKAKEAEEKRRKESEASKRKERERELDLIKVGEKCLAHHKHLSKKK